MQTKEMLKSRAVFPIGTVMKLTDLSARQIRYYEEQGFFQAERSEGNHRMYSLNHVDLILDIHEAIASGDTIDSLKKRFEKKVETKKVIHWSENDLSDRKVRELFQEEFIIQSGMQSNKKL